MIIIGWDHHRRKHLPDEDIKYPQVSLIEFSSKDSPIKKGSKSFSLKNSNLWDSWMI